MEAVEHIQRLAGLGGKNVQLGLPHIAADETQALDQIRAQHLQPLPERFF
jgi:hypothetical protein